MWYSAVGCIITLTLSLLVAPRAAEAQPRGTVPRIGYVGDTPGPYVDAFRQGLRERGYIEGETIAIEYRWQEGRHERLPELVRPEIRLTAPGIARPASRDARRHRVRDPRRRRVPGARQQCDRARHPWAHS